LNERLDRDKPVVNARGGGIILQRKNKNLE